MLQNRTMGSPITLGCYRDLLTQNEASGGA